MPEMKTAFIIFVKMYDNFKQKKYQNFKRKQLIFMYDSQADSLGCENWNLKCMP